jgi:hypothetical protein
MLQIVALLGIVIMGVLALCGYFASERPSSRRRGLLRRR